MGLLKRQCELVNTTISPIEWKLIQEVANSLPGWRKGQVHSLTRYGFSGARIYVLQAPPGETVLPHVVKIADAEEAEDELRGLRIAGASIRNVKQFDYRTIDHLTAIYFPLLETEEEGAAGPRVVDAADVYEDCLHGRRDADSTIVPMLHKALQLMVGAHSRVDVDEVLDLRQELERYTRPKRESRAARVFSHGPIEIAGFRVDTNPAESLPTILNMKSSGFVGRVNHGDFHLSNIVADGELLTPSMIDFAWTNEEGHGLIDFAMLESSLRFMKFPHDINPTLILAVDRALMQSLDIDHALTIAATTPDAGNRGRLTAMIRAVGVVRTRMTEVYSAVPRDSLEVEYWRILFAILAGQEKFHDFPLLRTIVNLDWLRECAQL